MKRKDLVVVESKRKAERLAAILGKEYAIMSCPGHLRTLIHVDRQEMTEYYQVPGNLAFVERSLLQAAQLTNRIILATEPDREGEAIAWHIAEILSDRVRGQIHRIILPDLEEETVRDAVESPGHSINMNCVYAWRTRQMIDRLIVDALTPLMQRWKLADETEFDLGRTALVVLQMLVKREWDRSTQPTNPPWNVWVQLAASDKQFRAEMDDNNLLANEQEAYALIDLLLQPGTGWQVERIAQRRITEDPPPPFTLGTLFLDAAEQLWLAPGEVEAAARELYDAGLITYYRTGSTAVDPETTTVDLSMLEAAFGERLSPDPAAAGRLTAGEPGAIRPLDLGRDLLKVEGLSETARTVYNRIWLRYVASLLRPAKDCVQEVVVRPTWTGSVEPWEDAQTYPHPFTFRARLHDLVETGWQALYPWPGGQREGRGIDGRVPKLAVGSSLTFEHLTTKQMKNHPEPYTVAGLFNALEHHRLGCPQAVTAALEQLIEEDYVRLEDDHLLPTPRGEDVIFLCTTHFTEVLDLPFNVILEHMLDQVAGGELAREQVLAAFDKRFTPAADEARRAACEPVEGDLTALTLHRESA